MNHPGYPNRFDSRIANVCLEFTYPAERDACGLGMSPKKNGTSAFEGSFEVDIA